VKIGVYLIIGTRINKERGWMEEICPVCGLTDEESEKMTENKIIRFCENCLKEEKISIILDKLFQ
jgi:hypothetical protein